MRYSYLGLPTRKPVYPLGGVMVRHYPVIATHVSGPTVDRPYDGLVDLGADDTIFPKNLANLLGIDLTYLSRLGSNNLATFHINTRLGPSPDRATAPTHLPSGEKERASPWV